MRHMPKFTHHIEDDAGEIAVQVEYSHTSEDLETGSIESIEIDEIRPARAAKIDSAEMNRIMGAAWDHHDEAAEDEAGRREEAANNRHRERQEAGL
jgi:hypothetical protein